MEPEDFGNILQDCLDRLQQGQETVEQVLADYPELAGELAPELMAAAWIQAQQPKFEPRPGFVSSSRSRLLARLEQEKAAVQPAPAATAGGFSLSRLFHINIWAARLVVALLVVAFLFTAGSGVSYATRNVVPGDTFYSIKLTAEKAQLALTLAEPSRAALQVEFVQRRLAEINVLSLEGRYEQIPDSAKSLQVSVNQAMGTLKSTARSYPGDAKVLGEKLDKALKEQGQMLKMWARTAPPAARAAYGQILSITETSSVTVEGIIATATATIPVGTLTPTPAYTGLPAVPVASPGGSPTAISPGSGSAPTVPVSTSAPVQGTPQPGKLEPSATTPAPKPSHTVVKPTSRPTNTHRPTQKPDSTKSAPATKEPPATREPPATKEPRPTKPGKP